MDNFGGCVARNTNKKSQPVCLPADFHDNTSFKNYTNVVVVSDTTEHGVCKTDVARAIRILNGFVVLDIFGLTLSRAVGLVIT